MKHQFFKKTLENGMTVLYEERKGSGVISLAIAAKHGGINEPLNEKGISHFIEHMVFKGTKNRTAKQISEAIEKNGGILNAFTEEEFTNYWCKLPSDKADIGLDVLSDMILNPLFEEKELNKERQVIFEEMKMRRDRPDIYVVDQIQSLLYTGTLSTDFIGTEESMKSITKKKITEKFKNAYGSENMILCAVGDSNFEKLCRFCEKTFKKSGFKLPEPVFGNKNMEKIDKRKGIDQVNLVFAYHVPNAKEKEVYTAQILSCLMVGGMSSRLFQEIREKRNLAYSVRGGYAGGRRYGYNTVIVGTSPENLEKVKSLIIEEFNKLPKELDEKELNQVKEQLIGNSKISREDSPGQMLDLLYNEVWCGDAGRSYDYEKNIKKVKLEDVKKLVQSAKRYSFIALIPEKSSK
jgi:predicted Zn-dependent peptidase